MNNTIIKRLKQNNTEFVPITLAEAVVVNGEHIWEKSEITTLDSVLRTLYGKDANLNKQIEDLNTQLSNKQGDFVAGEGITITPDENGKLIISSSLSLYQIVSTLPTADESCENKIYLVGSEAGKMEEYICVNKNNTYYWEQVGLISVSDNVDLSGYITTEEFTNSIGAINNKIDTNIKNISNSISSIQLGMITASNVTDSNNNNIYVDYVIPNTLYDSIITNDHIGQ